MKIQPTTKDAYKLLHEGAIALSQIQANGMRIDEPYLDAQLVSVTNRIKDISFKLKEDPFFGKWKRKYGNKTQLGNRQQLVYLLFEEGLYKPSSLTAKGKFKADKTALDTIDHPYVKDYLTWQKLRKVKGTYLEGIKRELVDGFLHPFFNLHTVITYRSSSSSPNFQNLPSRDSEYAELVRKAFIPGNGRMITEMDFSGIEVRSACVYTKDPRLIDDFTKLGKDPHRDTAMQLFLLSKEEVFKKTTRDCAKNMFVFPEFFGSVYFQCAPHIWEAMEKRSFRVGESGKLIRDHLAEKGIKSLGSCDSERSPRPGTFEYLVQQVEKDFWENRFKVYSQWKRSWWNKYEKEGGFSLLTGFRINGIFSKNEVLNFGIQGCLHGSSKVQTKTGWIPIRDLVGVKTKVWTGFQWADAVGLDRGKCQLAKIRLSSGIIVKCDTRHKLKNEKDEWIDFKNLQIGDYVALPKNTEPIPYSGEINWPFVFGFIIGDGCLSSSDNLLEIVGGIVKKPILEKIRDFLIKQGYDEEGYRSVRWKVIPERLNKKEKYKVSLQDYRFADFLKRNGFDFTWKSHTKRIPKCVWTMSVQDQRDFMEGLWLSDGNRADSQKYNLHMCNRPLLREIQILISGLGFDSKLCTTKNGYLLRITWRDFNSKSHRKYPVKAIRRLVEDVNLSNYDNMCESITDRRNFKGGKNISQYVAERIIEHNSTRSKCVYRYDRIEDIVILDKEENTYTMSVDDHLHQFVADGVIHKNTAFHWLLWSLTKMQKWLKKNKMRSYISGQIHDSIIGDTHPDELQDYLNKLYEIITVDLPKHWNWINVPIEVEAEVCPVDGNWFQKAVWCKNNYGSWSLK